MQLTVCLKIYSLQIPSFDQGKTDISCHEVPLKKKLKKNQDIPLFINVRLFNILVLPPVIFKDAEMNLQIILHESSDTNGKADML